MVFFKLQANTIYLKASPTDSYNLNHRTSLINENVRLLQPTRNAYITVITTKFPSIPKHNQNNKFRNNNILNGGTNARSKIFAAFVEINPFSLWFGTHYLVWRIKIITVMNDNETCHC